ncbi:hypothetical protein D3C72_2325520 [compost metagenome]
MPPANRVTLKTASCSISQDGVVVCAVDGKLACPALMARYSSSASLTLSRAGVERTDM